MLLRELTNNINQAKATAVLGWGRGMGHKGHMLLAQAVIHHAEQINAEPFFVVSRTTLIDPDTGDVWADRKKVNTSKDDPLTPDEKIATYKKVFPNQSHIFSVATEDASTLLQVIAKLSRQGFKNIVLVVGEKEVAGFSYLSNPDKSGTSPMQQVGVDTLKIISRQETNAPGSDVRKPDYQEGPRATPLRQVLLDPNKSQEEQFAIWRDAMPDKLSDEEVMDLMQKAKDRLVKANTPVVRRKKGVAEGNEWQGNRGNSQAGITDHTFDEAKQYIKGNYPFHKTYNVSRVEPGMRYHANPEKVANKTQSLVKGIDSALDYLQVKQNPMMSGSTQVTPSIGYSWHTHESRANGIAVLYYEDRGMGNDTITIAAKDRNNLKGAVQVCRDAGVIPLPKVKEQGVAEGLLGLLSKAPIAKSSSVSKVTGPLKPGEMPPDIVMLINKIQNKVPLRPDEYLKLQAYKAFKDAGSMSLKEANMLARALREGSVGRGGTKTIDKEKKAAMRNATTLPDLNMSTGRGGAYMNYRMAVALAGAPTFPTKIEADNWIGGDPLISSYTEEEFEMVKAAAKQVGAGKIQNWSGKRSEEMADVNKTSTVAKPKKNKYGV